MIKKILENESLVSQSLAFDPVLPRSTEPGFNPPMDAEHYIPKGAVVNQDGAVELAMYAPKAVEVTASLGTPDHVVRMVKQSSGVWTGSSLPDSKGFLNLDFYVDGNLVINPMAPIGFGASKPINFINVPEDGCEKFLCRDVPHGSVSHEFFFSSVTGRTESCLIYLPAQYHSCGDKKYPVLYLQHGHGENENCWITQGKMNFILDNLIEEGKARPMIVVMNNGMVQKNGSVCSDVMTTGFEELLLKDVIPFVENHFRTKTGRLWRGMAGLSMGSMQTSWTSFRHTDLFAYIGVFSGFMRGPDGQGENSHLAVLDDADRFNKETKVFFRAMGDKDPFFDIFKKDTELCQEKNIHCETKIYDGYHEWKVWRECIYDFLPLIF